MRRDWELDANDKQDSDPSMKTACDPGGLSDMRGSLSGMQTNAITLNENPVNLSGKSASLVWKLFFSAKSVSLHQTVQLLDYYYGEMALSVSGNTKNS